MRSIHAATASVSNYYGAELEVDRVVVRFIRGVGGTSVPGATGTAEKQMQSAASSINHLISKISNVVAQLSLEPGTNAARPAR
eukprot:COSAG02_NODE_2924_length_7735_cov_4.298324_6_plen_83_part_00